MEEKQTSSLYVDTHTKLKQLLETSKSGSGTALEDVVPAPESLQQAKSSLLASLPAEGTGTESAVSHILNDIVPGLNKSSLSPNYYGFVTGGFTEAAGLADQIVSAFDQNVQVHLPQETVSTEMEHRALQMLLELFELQPTEWPGRTFTTGATASNVVGLACAREGVIDNALRRARGQVSDSVGQKGIIAACLEAGLSGIQVLTTMSHSSLRKAASVVGLGRDAVIDVGRADGGLPWIFDLNRLEAALREQAKASVVVISCGEVNTGRFATRGFDDFQNIRALCDRYGAWIHVDGAFGIFGRLADGQEHEAIKAGCEGLELADSIAGDGHKLLNVPYDCGFVFCRSLDTMQSVFQNSNAAYLSSSSTTAVPSPLNIGIENSRRFRALPVYATLAAYGKAGYRAMLRRQISLARRVVEYLATRAEHFEILPSSNENHADLIRNTYIIVLFRAKDSKLNQQLVAKMNESRKIYVSGTSWESKPAARLAISNWYVETDRDIRVIREVLDGVIAPHER